MAKKDKKDKAAKRKSKRRDEDHDPAAEAAGATAAVAAAPAAGDAAPAVKRKKKEKSTAGAVEAREAPAPAPAAAGAAAAAARLAAAAAATADEGERRRLKAIAKKKRLKANRLARKAAAKAAAGGGGGASSSSAGGEDAAASKPVDDAALKAAADSIAKQLLKKQRKQQRKAAAVAAAAGAGASEAEAEGGANAVDGAADPRTLTGPNALFYKKLRETKGPKDGGAAAGDGGKKKGQKDGGWNRHIVFVGQLPYAATAEQIEAHFQRHGVEVAGVRMLTDKRTGKFRGTCFVDLPSARMQSVALRLHHSEFGDGAAKRCINVERTCGGGGKAENRQAKLQEMRAVQGEKVLKETKAIIASVVAGSDNATAKACELDEKVVHSLGTFPRAIAQQIVEDFVATVDDKVKNPNAWLMGTLKRYREGLANGEDLASLKVSDETNTQHYRPGKKHQRAAGEGRVKEFAYDGTGTQDKSSSGGAAPQAADNAASNAKRYGYISYTD